MVGLSSSRTQHAVRLLTLLHICGESVGGSDPPEATKVIRSELRLQALDFWLRNPDYLADELVTCVEEKKIDQKYLNIAKSLLDNLEPHHFPMPKWLYGAYEALDDAFSFLHAYGLAYIHRSGIPPQSFQNQFFLTKVGEARAKELVKFEYLDWYPKQAELVDLVARNDKGNELKKRQYKQDQYDKTNLGENIASIRKNVEIRLKSLLSQESEMAS